MITGQTLSLGFALAVLAFAARPAAASNFCEADGKRYSIHSTRCADGKKLRCVAKDEWTEIGVCQE